MLLFSCGITRTLHTKTTLVTNPVVKRTQNVSDRPPLLSNSSQTFFSQAVFPAFGEETQVRSLWLFGAEAGFPLLAFPQSTEVEILRAIKETRWIFPQWDY